MPELRPLNDTLFLEIVYSEGDSELQEELQSLTRAYLNSLGNKMLTSSLHVEERRITASLEGKPQAQIGCVVAFGPDVREDIKKDDRIIFPLHAGSMVTVLDPSEKNYRRLFAVSEKACLALYRED